MFSPGRAAALTGALVISAALSSVVMLPLVPVDRLASTPIVELNYDAGETVGWPQLAATVADIRATLPSIERVGVLTRNYGQAGAIEHFRPALGPVHSGHNA